MVSFHGQASPCDVVVLGVTWFERLPAHDKMKSMNQQQMDTLVAAARRVRENAHAPYSGYRVGAAILTADGEIFTGCNVENASYGLSVCAERNAVAAAVASGRSSFDGVAIVTSSSPAASPCGACRQVLAEFGDCPVILTDLDGDRRMTSVRELLPDAFLPETLSRES